MKSSKKLRTLVGKGQFLKFEGVTTLTVECTSGALWVTGGDGREATITAGTKRKLNPAGLVVMEGLSETEVEISWK